MAVRCANHYTTGVQEWHIVSLLGEVTSPTTVTRYVSMMSDLCVLSTEKHWQPVDSIRCTQTTIYSARTKYMVRRWTSRELCYVTAVDGDWSVSPSVAWFVHPCTIINRRSIMLHGMFKLSYSLFEHERWKISLKSGLHYSSFYAFLYPYLEYNNIDIKTCSILNVWLMFNCLKWKFHYFLPLCEFI